MALAGESPAVAAPAAADGKAEPAVNPKMNLNSFAASEALHLTEYDLEPEALDSCCNHLVLYESNIFRIVWSIVLMLALFYTFTIFLLRFCFLTFHVDWDYTVRPMHAHDDGWNALERVVDLIFWVDLVANFFFTFRNERGVEVDSMRRIAVQYLQFHFWVNFLACIPDLLSAIVREGAGVENLKVARLTRLQRVSRLTRLMRLGRLVKLASFKTLGPYMAYLKSLKFARLANFIILLALIVHILACGWYLVAALSPLFGSKIEDSWLAGRNLGGEAPGKQWWTSMYFVLTVFTTVGFGDISASTNSEMIYLAVVMLLGCVIHSIIISEVIQAVTSTDRLQEFTDQHLALIDAFSEHCQLPWDTTQMLRQQIKYRAGAMITSSQLNKDDLKHLMTGKQLPRWLLGSLPDKMFNGNLIKNKLFVGELYLPPRLPCLLAIHLQNSVFEGGEIVYQMHDFPFNLFLIINGTFAHVGTALVVDNNKGNNNLVSAASSNDVAPPVKTTSNPILGGSSKAKITSNISRSPASSVRLQRGNSSSGKLTTGSSTATVAKPQNSLYPYRLQGFKCYFGDLEMINGTPRVSTVRCESRRGQTLLLHKTDYTNLRAEFPQYGALWQYSAKRHEWSRKRQVSTLCKDRKYRSLAVWIIQNAWRKKKGKLADLADDELEDAAMKASKMHFVNMQAAKIMDGKSVAGVNQEDVRDVKKKMDLLSDHIVTLHEEVRQVLSAMNAAPASRR